MAGGPTWKDGMKMGQGMATEMIFLGEGEISEAELSKEIEKMLEGVEGVDAKKRVKVISKHVDVSNMNGDVEKRVKIMRGEGNADDVQVFTFTGDEDVEVFVDATGDYDFSSGKFQTQARVEAAEDLLEGVDDEELSRDTRRKIEKAQKALEAARKALEKEQE